MKPVLSYCGQLVYEHNRDRFLLSLFIPASHREVFFGIYALNIELTNIRDLVTEEMIGHIRYAWWREAVEELYTGVKPRGQPVLQALGLAIEAGQMPGTVLMPLLNVYCDHFPGAPPELERLLEEMTVTLLRSLCPDAESRWRKAHRIITKHRLLHGRRRNGWLSFKLLIAGL